jgi:hypothetical protein
MLRCLKSSKRSINSFRICLESKLRMKFDLYCDCENKRSNFFVFKYPAAILSYTSMIRLWNSLPWNWVSVSGNLMSYLEAHGHNEWKELPLTRDSDILNPVLYQHVQTAGTLLLVHRKLHIGFWWGNLREWDHLEDLVHGRIILKLMWWPQWQVAGWYKHGNGLSSPIKCGGYLVQMRNN